MHVLVLTEFSESVNQPFKPSGHTEWGAKHVVIETMCFGIMIKTSAEVYIIPLLKQPLYLMSTLTSPDRITRSSKQH